MKNENPKNALFIVHWELIAKQAMKSYRKVFGVTKKMALLSGNSKEYDADILFATMNMMARQETFDYLEQHDIHYDWICIDEYGIIGTIPERLAELRRLRKAFGFDDEGL